MGLREQTFRWHCLQPLIPVLEKYYNLIDLSPVYVAAVVLQDHSRTFPSLSRIAFDMLSVPAMSAECEREFSSAKLLISDPRNRLSEELIEASECLWSWGAAGFISL